ncbi:MAG: hypothetical protein L6R39_000853 [Caloplaca ligustica]|nr:MAG: hypothetical protein L6R39_000853 [Caloplaca ligustica]
MDGEMEEGDAVRLVQVLDHMPLAISQAAAYINQRAPRITPSRYLDAFRTSDRDQANLLNRDAGDIRRDQSVGNSIITSWQISFDHIRQQRPSAARLLSWMSLFDRQGIPERLLHRLYEDNCNEVASPVNVETNLGEDIGSEVIATVDVDTHIEDDIDIEFEDDISTLTNFSLVRISNLEDGLFDMHRLVQLSTRAWLELSGDLGRWTQRYITMICEAFPDVKYDTWTQCRALFPHAEVLFKYQAADKQSLREWANVLTKAPDYAAETGNYSTAEAIERRTLEGREKVLGREDPDTLASVHNLSLTLPAFGKYKAAEELCQRAIKGNATVFGKEHPYTLDSITHLGTVLRDLGKYEAAEELLRRVTEEQEKALGKEHQDTLRGIVDLGILLHDQEKYVAAEKLYQRAIVGQEKIFGKEHPETLITVGKLGLTLGYQGKYEAAEVLLGRATEGHEKVFGRNHPRTLDGVSNLGGVMVAQKKYTAGKELLQRAIEGKVKILGKEHPSTLISVSNLGGLLLDRGKYDSERYYSGGQ